MLSSLNRHKNIACFTILSTNKTQMKKCLFIRFTKSIVSAAYWQVTASSQFLQKCILCCGTDLNLDIYLTENFATNSCVPDIELHCKAIFTDILMLTQILFDNNMCILINICWDSSNYCHIVLNLQFEFFQG